MKSRFVIDELEPSEALAVWKTSPHATVFTNPAIASRLSSSVSWFAAIKGSEVFVVWPVALNRHGKVDLPWFSYYFGPFWSEVAVARSISSGFADRLDAYDGLVTTLIQRFGAIRAELHPLLSDVRVFSWWNYHSPEKPKFSIEPRYTAQIAGLQKSTEAQLLSRMRGVRRREINRVERQGELGYRTSVSVGDLTDLYISTFERQQLVAPSDDLDAIVELHALVEEGLGTITASANGESGDLAAAVLSLDAHDTSNMVLSLSSPLSRKSSLVPWTVYKSICEAKALGFDYFDFNGANSPQRGDDKHSYGATDVLYFSLQYSEQN